MDHRMADLVLESNLENHLKPLHGLYRPDGDSKRLRKKVKLSLIRHTARGCVALHMQANPVLGRITPV
jgi:hypothetical protein